MQPDLVANSLRCTAALAVTALLLVGCANGDRKGDPAPAKASQPVAGRAAEPAVPTGGSAGGAINRVVMASGLIVEDLVIGDGPACIDPNANVEVRFKSMLADGTVYDATEGTRTARYPLKQLIRGWQDGIPGMRVGGKRRLSVPWQLGYGDREVPQKQMVIPAKSNLVFEIELVGLS